MGIVSYAQNFEDIMLWRALGHIERGCYIDIGAQHPAVDSVSKAFYDHGWRGINIEPTVFYADLMRRERPEDLVIQAAIGETQGLLPFFEIPETGLSTASPSVAEGHRLKGYGVRETVVTALTMDALLGLVKSIDIHWLKIDVEGFERQVLSGWRESLRRPWIMIIESTAPNSQVETHQAWESLVLDKGYELAFIDGLNRYYLSAAHGELKGAFLHGPCIFDGFELSEYAWAIGSVKRYHAEAVAKLSNQLAALRETYQQLEAHSAERERLHREEAQKELETARSEVHGLTRQSAERERVFTERLSQLSEAYIALQRQMVKCESEFSEFKQKLQEQAFEDAQIRAQELLEREREFNAALATQREARLTSELQAAELNRQIEAAHGLEALLRENLVRQSERAALVEAQLSWLQSTIFWRLSSPLRKLGFLFGGDREIKFYTPGRLTLQTMYPAPDPRQDSLSAPAAPADPQNLQHQFINQSSHMPPIQHVDQLLDLHGSVFLAAAYQSLLGRSPDVDGERFYLGRLRAGHGKASVIAQLSRSSEAKTYEVGLRLAGLDHLITEQKKANHWLWRMFFGTSRIVRRFNQLEYQLGLVANSLEKLELQIAAPRPATADGSCVGIAQSAPGVTGEEVSVDTSALTARARQLFARFSQAEARTMDAKDS